MCKCQDSDFHCCVDISGPSFSVIVIPRLSFSSSVGTVFLLFLDFPVPLSASPMLLLHKTKLLLFSSLRWLGHAHIFCLAGVVMVLIGGWSGY